MWCAAFLLVSAVAAAPASTSFLSLPATAAGASIRHSPSFSSLSFEPAFFAEFIGNKSHPNQLTLGLIETLHKHGSRPNIRPGGITMDSMVFDAAAVTDVVRLTDGQGAVYGTVVGPGYYASWNHLPQGTQFVSTLNFGNKSFAIARDLALASVRYQSDKVLFFELGNEPNNYASTDRWNGSTQAYVDQWKNWTSGIDREVNGNDAHPLPVSRWWASSSTTDKTKLNVRPVDIIPDGIDSQDQVAEYSIHSYAFATCDPTRTAIATIPNLLNHTRLTEYADEEIMPSANAALASGTPWIIGEFNSIACSGKTNVSNTFAQALWTIDTELIYAARNATAVYLHQGATLKLQSSDQANKPPPDGTPLFSSYSFVYPVDSTGRGMARVLPGFYGLLFIAEALSGNGTRVRSLECPSNINSDYFSAYGLYTGGKLSKVVIINMTPYWNETENESTFTIKTGIEKGSFKRLTAPSVGEDDAGRVSWAGQSYANVEPVGTESDETLGCDGEVRVRGSEAVLIIIE